MFKLFNSTSIAVWGNVREVFNCLILLPYHESWFCLYHLEILPMSNFKVICLLSAFGSTSFSLLAPALLSQAQVPPIGELVANHLCESYFTLYEGNSAGQAIVGQIEAWERGIYRLSDVGIPNDEARSVVLRHIPAGTRLQFFNSPGCGEDDDWGEIVAKEYINERMIYTFELVYEDDEIYVAWNNRGGLDGKVSCIRVVTPWLTDKTCWSDTRKPSP